MNERWSDLLYKVIKLRHDRPEAGLTRGTLGTIVLIFEEPEPVFEVEFIDDYGRTVAQIALTRDEFELVPY